jgi:hypothetical protein
MQFSKILFDLQDKVLCERIIVSRSCQCSVFVVFVAETVMSLFGALTSDR